METLQLSIDGMTCNHCIAAVRNALATVPGVDVQDVHIGGAKVRYDPQQARPDAIIDAVGDEGYQAAPA